MHDTELEQRLRTALHDEADRLPLRVDVGRLETEVAVRRQAARSSRLGLLAAAVGVVAFGIAAIGLNGGLPAGILPGVHGASPRDGALVVGLASLGVTWQAALGAVALTAVLAWAPAVLIGGAFLGLRRLRPVPAGPA